MEQYQQHHYDKEMLQSLALNFGIIDIESQCDLEQVRNMLNTRFENSLTYPKLSADWCFIDCKQQILFHLILILHLLIFLFISLACTAEHFFRIDRAQEHLHYICDIAVDELYILDNEAATLSPSLEEDQTYTSYSPDRNHIKSSNLIEEHNLIEQRHQLNAIDSDNQEDGEGEEVEQEEEEKQAKECSHNIG